MKNYVAAAVAAAAVAIATPAFAQDSTPIEVYGGIIAGLDHVRLSEGGDSGHKDGLVYGGVIGAQSGIGSSGLVGIEGEITGATTRERANNVFALGDSARLKAGRDLFIGARLGFRAAPSVLVYAKGGYTNARVSLRYTAGGITTHDGDNLDGYRIGAGVEVGTGRIRLRGEYRYSDYGNYKYQGVDTGISAQRHQIVAGAIYAF